MTAQPLFIHGWTVDITKGERELSERFDTWEQAREFVNVFICRVCQPAEATSLVFTVMHSDAPRVGFLHLAKEGWHVHVRASMHP